MKRQLVTVFAITLALSIQAQAATVGLTVVNPGFETDTAPAQGATGWSIATGGTATEFWTTDGSGLSGGDPDTGQGPSTNFLTANRLADGTGSNPTSSTASQNIDISAFATDIDAGGVTADFDFFYQDSDAADSGSATIEFFDGSLVSLGSTSSGTLAGTAVDAWVAGTVGGGTVAVPVGARSLTISLLASRTSGSATNLNYDSTSVALDGLAVIPAPAALPAGLAMLGLVAMRRRR